MANDRSTEPLLVASESDRDDGTFAYRKHPQWQKIAEGKQANCCCSGYAAAAAALGLFLFALGLGLGLLLRPYLHARGVAV